MSRIYLGVWLTYLKWVTGVPGKKNLTGYQSMDRPGQTSPGAVVSMMKFGRLPDFNCPFLLTTCEEASKLSELENEKSSKRDNISEGMSKDEKERRNKTRKMEGR